MHITITRRGFLHASAATAATAATVATIPSLAFPPGDRASAAPAIEARTVPSACEMCTARCPIIVHVSGGAVSRLEGNPADKATQGAICARGNAGLSLLNDPQRLTHPLIRTGERGSGEYREASWEEAYAYIGERLGAVRDEYGPQALAVARRPSSNDVFLKTFAAAYGTPNTFTHESTCPLARNVALDTTLGTAGVAIDYGKVQYLIIFGRNILESLVVPQVQGVLRALDAGAQVVYLDPRFTPTAEKATKWLQIRPGEDLAFALAMLNVIIGEGLYDRDFVDRYTVGFEELARRVGEYTPEWAAEKTGIPASEIIWVARGFASARPRAVADFGWYSAGYANDFQLRRTILALNAVVGNLEVPGGIFFIKGLGKYELGLGSWEKPELPKVTAERADGAGVPGRMPLTPANDGIIQALPEIILSGKPYPIRAFIAYRFNPVAAIPDRERTIAAMKELDLLVSIDVYQTDTGTYADVVLPECTYLERTDPVFEASGLAPKIRLRQQAVAPLGEARPGWRIWKEMAEAAGIGDYFAYRDIDEVIAAQLAPMGVSVDELRSAGQWMPPGIEPLYLREKDPRAEVALKTPSGKIELESHHVAEAGFDPLPGYVAPPATPAGRLAFLQGKSAMHTNSATQNIPWLWLLQSENELWLHPDDAAALAIGEGDGVVVRADQREERGVAHVTDQIGRGAVFSYHGWGRIGPGRMVGKGVSDNALLPALTDPITGSCIMRETFVEVVKA